MRNTNVAVTTNPPGWPAHLQAYDPGRHRPRQFGQITLYPYDHTQSRVKTYVAICAERWYAGTVSVGRGEPHQATRRSDGRSAFPVELADAAAFLAEGGRHGK